MSADPDEANLMGLLMVGADFGTVEVNGTRCLMVALECRAAGTGESTMVYVAFAPGSIDRFTQAMQENKEKLLRGSEGGT